MNKKLFNIFVMFVALFISVSLLGCNNNDTEDEPNFKCLPFKGELTINGKLYSFTERCYSYWCFSEEGDSYHCALYTNMRTHFFYIIILNLSSLPQNSILEYRQQFIMNFQEVGGEVITCRPVSGVVKLITKTDRDITISFEKAVYEDYYDSKKTLSVDGMITLPTDYFNPGYEEDTD